MANDIVQTIAEARVDARSLSDFVFKPADFMVARRLAPSVRTLQYYVDFFNTLQSSFATSVSAAQSSLSTSVSQAQDKVAYIETTVQNAINNTAVEGGVLADTFVVVDGTLSQRTINKGLESIADLLTINNPKDGLRVYVKSYHTGLGKGGGYFVYDTSKLLVNDGGLIINGWVREDTTVITVEMFGAVGDGAVDDSLAFQLALDYGGNLTGTTGAVYYLNECYTKKDTSFDGNGCTFKYLRAGGDSAPWLPAQREYTWTDSTGTTTTGQETMIDIRHNGKWSNFYVDGNGVPYNLSANYPNTMLEVFWIEGVNDVLFDRVHISSNNSSAITVYDSTNFRFVRGSIRDSIALTGSKTNQEQITLLSSSDCYIADNFLGGFCPWSAISTLGGKNKITTGGEIGGWFSYANKGTRDIEAYESFGRTVGDSDGNHVIERNVVTSEPKVGEASGGGVSGRNITINSTRCIVRNNYIYNTAPVAQAGIGLGHERTTDTTTNIAMQASYSEVYGNTIAGFSTSNNGVGILNNGSEGCDIHHNLVYNCNIGLDHTRYATNSKWQDNVVIGNGKGMRVGGLFSGLSPNKSHGNDQSLDISENIFIDNTQQMVYEDGSGWFEGSVCNNRFVDTKANSAQQIHLYHGDLKFEGNEMITASTNAQIVLLYAAKEGSSVSVKNNKFWCTSSPTTEGDNILRLRSVPTNLKAVTLSNNDFHSANNTSNLNRRVQMSNMTADKILEYNNSYTNTGLTIGIKALNANLSGSLMTLQGSTAIGVIGSLSSGTPRVFKIDNMTFDGGGVPINVSVTTGSGVAVVANCIVMQDKYIAKDFTNEARYLLYNNYKLTPLGMEDAQVTLP